MIVNVIEKLVFKLSQHILYTVPFALFRLFGQSAQISQM